MDIAGKIAVVTGAASGIGAATAALLRERGATVVGWDRSEGVEMRVDVSDQEQVRAAVRSTIELAGVPELVVLAASIHARSDFEATPLEDFDRVIGVNVRGMYSCMQEIVKEMKAAEQGGAFVLFGSLAGLLADPKTVAYSLSKAAINHLGRVAAVELGSSGIRVNVVNPGAIVTEMTRRNLSDPAYRQLVLETTPLGGLGKPEYVAEVVLALLQLDWVTGQAISVDGGSSLVTPRGAKRGSLGDFSAGEKFASSAQVEVDG